jgi:hypothetical protein
MERLSRFALASVYEENIMKQARRPYDFQNLSKYFAESIKLPSNPEPRVVRSGFKLRVVNEPREIELEDKWKN